jgi:hypothetical protein
MPLTKSLSSRGERPGDRTIPIAAITRSTTAVVVFVCVRPPQRLLQDMPMLVVVLVRLIVRWRARFKPFAHVGGATVVIGTLVMCVVAAAVGG